MRNQGAGTKDARLAELQRQYSEVVQPAAAHLDALRQLYPKGTLWPVLMQLAAGAPAAAGSGGAVGAAQPAPAKPTAVAGARVTAGSGGAVTAASPGARPPAAASNGGAAGAVIPAAAQPPTAAGVPVAGDSGGAGAAAQPPNVIGVRAADDCGAAVAAQPGSAQPRVAQPSAAPRDLPDFQLLEARMKFFAAEQQSRNAVKGFWERLVGAVERKELPPAFGSAIENGRVDFKGFESGHYLVDDNRPTIYCRLEIAAKEYHQGKGDKAQHRLGSRSIAE